MSRDGTLKAHQVCDVSTNTEAEFPHRQMKRRSQDAHRSSTLRRSQTFAPASKAAAERVVKVRLTGKIP